jgi:hypothetical protein
VRRLFAARLGGLCRGRPGRGSLGRSLTSRAEAADCVDVDVIDVGVAVDVDVDVEVDVDVDVDVGASGVQAAVGLRGVEGRAGSVPVGCQPQPVTGGGQER